MADIIDISESNGAGETVTDSISNGNWGSNDSANLVTTTYPIVAGENSYIKYWRLYWTTEDVYTQLDNIRVYQSAGTLSGSDVLEYEADATYATPVATELVGDGPMPTTFGTAAAITGTLTAQGQYSSYLATQLQVDIATTAGASGITVTWVYDAQG